MPATKSPAGPCRRRIRRGCGRPEPWASGALKARSPDRDVFDARDRLLPVGQYQAVEFDKLMALALVVGRHLGAHAKFVTDADGREMLHLAADVNPGTEQDIVRQCPIE